MNHLLVAALDDTAAATPVLEVTVALAELLGARIDAIHVAEDGGRTARSVCERHDVELRRLEGPVVDTIAAAADHPEVLAVVIGARRHDSGRRRVGHVARELLTRLGKPVVVVPPRVRLPVTLQRMLVPMEASHATASALGDVVRIAGERGVVVTLLHVHERSQVPSFDDQPQHDTTAWVDEFVARYAPSAAGPVRVELRIGSPDALVLSIAAEIDADLILLGWSRDLSPGHAAVVRRVLEEAAVPLVLVPILTGAGDDASPRH